MRKSVKNQDFGGSRKILWSKHDRHRGVRLEAWAAHYDGCIFPIHPWGNSVPNIIVRKTRQPSHPGLNSHEKSRILSGIRWFSYMLHWGRSYSCSEFIVLCACHCHHHYYWEWFIYFCRDQRKRLETALLETCGQARLVEANSSRITGGRSGKSRVSGAYSTFCNREIKLSDFNITIFYNVY